MSSASKSSKPGLACASCGFFSADDMALGTADASVMLCEECREAERVLSGEKSETFHLTWNPDISQANLLHLCRVIALVRVLFERRCAGSVCETNNARAIVGVLAEQKKQLDRRFESVIGCEFEEAWPFLPKDVREKLLPGLRAIPRGFKRDRVYSWLDNDSSMNGYGIDYLIHNDWFSKSLIFKD